MICETRAHVEVPMSFELKRQDGENFALVVLVTTKKEEKEKDHLVKKATYSQKSPSWSSIGWRKPGRVRPVAVKVSRTKEQRRPKRIEVERSDEVFL